MFLLRTLSLMIIYPFSINAKDIIYIGIRDVDDKEKAIIHNLGIKSYEVKDVRAKGVKGIIEEALQTLDPLSNKQYHLSFDIDGIDIDEAPSTGTRVKDGLTTTEGASIVNELLKTQRLLSMDLVEFNPKIGSLSDVDTTLKTCSTVISKLLENETV